MTEEGENPKQTVLLFDFVILITYEGKTQMVVISFSSDLSVLTDVLTLPQKWQQKIAELISFGKCKFNFYWHNL